MSLSHEAVFAWGVVACMLDFHHLHVEIFFDRGAGSPQVMRMNSLHFHSCDTSGKSMILLEAGSKALHAQCLRIGWHAMVIVEVVERRMA